ncbi:MAG TPA: SPOR domain-containing protein [Bryobacteraceae bacterium]|nr:SPOR domain-containing protein [Bryobacteraceae bacterium]
MTQTDGEKELVLGNKQLISLFFVVVALCGVFFAMGYMVRGNTLKGALTGTGDDAGAASGTGSTKRQQPEPPRETSDAQPDSSAAVPANPPAAEGQPAEAPVETRPAQDAGAAPPPAAMKSEPVSEASAPESGASYVQVAALPRSDAEAMVRTLRERSLPAIIVASPKEGLYRVLVGPYHQTVQIADAKARLKTLGFSNTIVQKM